MAISTLPVENGIMVIDTEYAINHLLQLSYIIISPDWEEKKSVNYYFAYPEHIENETAFQFAIRANGLTRDFMSMQKLSVVEEALHQLFKDMKQVDIVVGHNISADISVIDKNIDLPVEWADTYCTYKDHNSPFAKLKLVELAKSLNVEYPKQYHTDGIQTYKDSLTDCRVTLECFKKLYDMGCVFSPDGSLFRNCAKFENHSKIKSFGIIEYTTELKFSDDKLTEYNFVGKRFIVSGVSSEQKNFLRDAVTKLGGKWISSICGDRANADVLIAGERFTPDVAYKKFHEAVQLQKDNPKGFIVFSEKAVEKKIRLQILRKLGMKKSDAENELIAFWATAMIENGDDAIACFTPIAPNGCRTNREILECAVFDKDLEGYGKPLNKYLEYKEQEMQWEMDGIVKKKKKKAKDEETGLPPQTDSSDSTQLALF